MDKFIEMKYYKVLVCLLIINLGCANKESKMIDAIVETKNNDQIILSGDFIFYDNAGVLQTPKKIYGIIFNKKLEELKIIADSIKKDEYDSVHVILKGKLYNKDKDQEGWDVKLEITEIVEIINKEI